MDDREPAVPDRPVQRGLVEVVPGFDLGIVAFEPPCLFQAVSISGVSPLPITNRYDGRPQCGLEALSTGIWSTDK